MQGATEFYRIIQNAQRRKLGGLRKLNCKYGWSGGNSEAYINDNIIFVTSSHARGECFHIYLVEDTTQNDDEIKRNAFEVYGVTGGNLGWTETYGWIRKGTWVVPILKYLKDLDKEIHNYDEQLEFKKVKERKLKNKSIENNVNKFNNMFRQVV